MKLDYKVLYVEDDENIRQNYVAVLRDMFLEVYEADNGLDAYDVYLENKPDIMIIDIDIPKLNGLELLEKIRKIDFNVKAIMLTSYSDKETLLKAVSLKLTEYLVKPIQRKKLFDALNMAIDEIKEFTVSTNKILNLKDGYYWDFISRELRNHKSIISLTKTERGVLEVICKNSSKNKMTTYNELLSAQWNEYGEMTMDSLKTFMKLLRKKLPDETIVNVYGSGYKL